MFVFPVGIVSFGAPAGQLIGVTNGQIEISRATCRRRKSH